LTINKNNPCVLAIETSCDDTSIAVLKKDKILANVTANQEIHSKYGGVVPELASRDHEKNIAAVYQEALNQAKVEQNELDAIAFTQGPGLLGSLMVGTSFAKSLSLGLNIPLIAVNHLQAHVAALYIQHPKPLFPFICLLVSGGHTQIIEVTDYFVFEILGSTLDDAAGEAFDKIGKMLDLPYPAGPHIDQLAKSGDGQKFQFTYSKVPDFNYSFSGLKTQVLYFVRDQLKMNTNFVAENIQDLCASIQNHICTYLLKPVKKIMAQKSMQGVAIVGGVSANSSLREITQVLAKSHGVAFMVPDLEYCTDNAAMVAQVAKFKYQKGEFVELDVIAKARF